MLLLLIALLTPLANAATHATAVQHAQRTAEQQIRNLVEPVLEKYCHDECRLMGITATIDVATPEEVAPGFDDIDPSGASRLAPSSARIRLLIDEKVGPVSRGKILDLVQQYLETLEYGVKIDLQATRFPQPVGSAGKIAEMRERISKQFRSTLEDLFRQFCPEQCLLADYELQTELVNAEEAQYGHSGEFIEDGGVAIRIRNIAGTILVDDSLPFDERTNVLEMAKFKTNAFRNVSLASKSLKFPKPTAGLRRLASLGADSRTSSQSSDNIAKQESFHRIEKIERVESGDAVQAELQKFKVYGLIFACSVISLLIFLAMSGLSGRSGGGSSVQRMLQQMVSDPVSTTAPLSHVPGGGIGGGTSSDERAALVIKRYEIERLKEDLQAVFAQQPKVAKHVFTRVLTEEGVEITSQYIHILGESVVIDMIRDPSLQADVQELMEFYAKNPTDLTDDDQLELLRKLHNRTIAGKMAVMGSRSSGQFDFLAEMDGQQILELIRNESLTVKSIVLTQTDSQKRSAIYTQLDDDSRAKLLGELSRIDYLPRDYIFNVASSLKRKRLENPKLNTEALPGSDVLLTLLERTGCEMQQQVIRNLDATNPEAGRHVKAKLVSVDTLRYLRDGQLLEVVLSLRHDELLQFLKGAPEGIRMAVFSKSPKDLVIELEEEMAQLQVLSRETYQNIERKVLNRMKVMANEGLINLIETNERMFADTTNAAPAFVEGGPPDAKARTGKTPLRKVAGW